MLHHWESGGGDPVVLGLHETAATGQVWRGLAAGVGGRGRLIAPDRRGWGASEPPPGYRATSIAEQAADAAGLLDELGVGRAVVCGAGLGAVVALELLLQRPALVSAAILIEPPLLAFVPEATEAFSDDALALREAAHEGGAEAAFDLYLSGSLTALGPGAAFIPPPVANAARSRPLSLFAELGAVPAWPLPLERLVAVTSPVLVLAGPSTPAAVARAARELVARMPAAEAVESPPGGPAHLVAASELAELALGVSP